MGTLMHQEPRNFRHVEIEHVEARLEQYIDIAKRKKVSLSDVIATARVLEMQRASNVFVANGDVHDEQMTGFGKILSNIEGHFLTISTYFLER